MCKFCDILKQKVTDDWIENLIDEDKNHDRKFYLMKYGDNQYGIMFDSKQDAFDIDIKFCPFCGRKLED